MDENNLTLGFCRACLIKYTDPLELIYYSEKNRRLFVYATGLQVKHNDNFLFQLCKNCFSNMKIASKFKKLCRTSDKRFKTFMDLKKAGSNLDFCNYIKNADTSYMYRMPALYDSSPHKPSADNDKDETASTSTSIRNFMTDILREEDIPATEAKIISQVIAEEADILEDSIDSHWLDDDDLTVNDDMLDFSFSPFSTPKVGTEERYSPFTNDRHENKETNTNKYQYETSIKHELLENMDIDDPLYHTNIETDRFIMDSFKTENIETISLDNPSPMKTIHINDNLSHDTPDKCVIDKNLAMALKNDNVQISLDDLLNTPKQIASGASTPLINKLLLLEEYNERQSTPDYIRNLDKPISLDYDKYQYFDPDELLQGLNKSSQSKETDNIDIAETNDGEYSARDEPIDNVIEPREENLDNSESESEKKGATDASFDFTNCYCKLCKLKFKALKGLKSHAKRKHDYQLPPAERTIRRKQLMICDHCGKEAVTEKGTFIKHLRTHTQKLKKSYKCPTCFSVFEKASHLKMHSYHHMGPEEKHKALEENRKHICATCGAKSATAATLRLHMLRHTKNYKFECVFCNKLFPRNHELNVHLRKHTGITPYECKQCNQAFKRRDQLTRHLVTHYYNYKCENCESCFYNEPDYQKHLARKKKCKGKKSIKKKKTGNITNMMVVDNPITPVLGDSTTGSDSQDVYILYVK